MSADAWEGKPMPTDPSVRSIVVRREGRTGRCSMCHGPSLVGVGVYLAGHVHLDHKHHYFCSECVIRMHRELMTVEP